MKQKIITFSLLLFLISHITKAQEWEFIGLDSLVILHLKIDEDTIYAGTFSQNNSPNSGLYYSSDRGNNWIKIDSLLGGGSIWDLEKNFDNTIYIIKCPCQAPLADSLFKSTNNGQSWLFVNNISTNPIQWIGISPFNPNKMYAIDVLDLGAGRYFNSLFKSTNKGNSWENIGSFPGSSHGSEINFSFDLSDSMNLYVSVDDNMSNSYFFKSTDEGSNWFYVSIPPFLLEIYSDYFIPDRIYLTPYPYISNNGGLSWFEADSGLTDTSYYISFYQDNSSSLLYLLKSDGLYFSRNDTIFWSKIEGSENLPLIMGSSGFPYYRLNLKNVFIDNLTKKIYVGTARGVFRRDLVTSIINEEINFPIEISLEQNYPNPFNPVTTISYQIPENCFVSLKVYDLLGKEITTLLEKELSPGGYEVSWEGQDSNGMLLPSAVYLIQLNAGNYTKTIKALLLK